MGSRIWAKSYGSFELISSVSGACASRAERAWGLSIGQEEASVAGGAPTESTRQSSSQDEAGANQWER